MSRNWKYFKILFNFLTVIFIFEWYVCCAYKKVAQKLEIILKFKNINFVLTFQYCQQDSSGYQNTLICEKSDAWLIKSTIKSGKH